MSRLNREPKFDILRIFDKKWKKIFFAKIQFVLYIFCKYDKMISFDGIMSIFHYVEKFLKNFES